MIIITGIKFITVPKNPYQVFSQMVPKAMIDESGVGNVELGEVQIDNVQGIRFCKFENDRRVFDEEIGFTSDVHEFLGFPLQELSKANERNDSLRAQLNHKNKENKKLSDRVCKLEDELDELKHMSPWDRVKFLFKGKV